MPLESSQRGLQLQFRPHLDRRSAQEIIVSQSCGTNGSLRTKSHSDVIPPGKCRVYYMGEGGGFPRVRAVMSLVSLRSPVVLSNPISELQHPLLPLKSVESQGMCLKLLTFPLFHT
jgi:hypothetical protein